MELKNASGDHIKKEKTSLSGFICIRLRERRPGLLLHFAKPGHLDVHFYSRFCLFSLLWVFPDLPLRLPTQDSGQKKADSEEGFQLWLNTVTTWSLRTSDVSLHVSGAWGRKGLNAVIPNKSTDCLDHLHCHPRLTFSSFGCFLSGLTVFFL